MKKKLIIDTNLLLLLIIGAVEEGRHIKSSKRLNAFEYSDYKLVAKVIGGFDKVFITPYIATEISNLIDLTGHVGEKVFDAAKNFFSIFDQIESKIIVDCETKFFNAFGITDSSLIGLVQHYTVFTDDNRLARVLYTIEEDNVITLDVAKCFRR